MAERDNKSLENVATEWMSGAGISLPVRTILGMLEFLMEDTGDNFSVIKACDTLEDLAGYAKGIRRDLIREYNTLQKSENNPE